jgi:uncharacterized cupin superfamily protein
MDDASSYSDMVKEHYMGYVYAGEIVIKENGAITKLHKGDSVFLRSEAACTPRHHQPVRIYNTLF